MKRFPKDRISTCSLKMIKMRFLLLFVFLVILYSDTPAHDPMLEVRPGCCWMKLKSIKLLKGPTFRRAHYGI